MRIFSWILLHGLSAFEIEDEMVEGDCIFTSTTCRCSPPREEDSLESFQIIKSMFAIPSSIRGIICNEFVF